MQPMKCPLPPAPQQCTDELEQLRARARFSRARPRPGAAGSCLSGTAASTAVLRCASDPPRPPYSTAALRSEPPHYSQWGGSE